MEENRNDLIPEEIEKAEEETKKEYKDPNENVFTSGPNTGNAESYNYGQSSGGQENYNGYNYQNNQYSQYTRPQQSQMDMSPLSMGEWLLTILIGMVPCVGLVVYCVWAFGSSGNLNRRNYCRAYLIIQVISLVLVFIFATFTTVFTMIGGMY